MPGSGTRVAIPLFVTNPVSLDPYLSWISRVPQDPLAVILGTCWPAMAEMGVY